MSEDNLFERIQSTGQQREDAIVSLRGLLLRGLSKSLNNRYGQPFFAEDIVQEALMKILDSLDQFEGRSKFTTWAMTIANRIGISALRRKYHQDVSMEAFCDNDGSRIEIAIAEESDGSALEDREALIAKLQLLIDSELSAKQRMAMRAFLAGYSTDGIAERTQSNRNAVYKLIHDARVKLREGLERSGITADYVSTIFA
jgi:RNA polymerase sigma factor (sigma-70 family)